MDKKVLTPDEFAKLSKDEQEQYLKGVESIKQQTVAIDNEAATVSQLTMKDFKELVVDAVKGQVDKMDKVDKKFNVFPGIGNDPNVLNDKSEEGMFKKSATFLRALVGGDVTTVKAISDEARLKANLSENSAQDGGFLVPEEFKNEILRLVPTYGVARANCRIIPMSRDVMSIPAAGAANQSAIWIGEGAKIKQTDPNFKQVALVTSKLAALPKFTNELLDDSAFNIVGYLSEIIAEAFAQEEDNQAFLGIGSPFNGMLKSTGVPDSAIAGTVSCLSYPDLVQATGKLYTNVLGGAKFYFHRSVIANIRNLTTTTGAPLFAAQATSILGYPLVGAEKLPSISQMGASAGTAFGIFGDIRRGYGFGERGTIRMKISTEGTVDDDNLFEQDMVALRAIERVAMAVLLASAWTTMSSA